MSINRKPGELPAPGQRSLQHLDPVSRHPGVRPDPAGGEKIDVHPGWLNFSVPYMWENDDILYVPTGTDKYELIFTTMLANLWFYLRPRGWLKMLTKSVAGGSVVLLPS